MEHWWVQRSERKRSQFSNRTLLFKFNSIHADILIHASNSSDPSNLSSVLFIQPSLHPLYLDYCTFVHCSIEECDVWSNESDTHKRVFKTCHKFIMFVHFHRIFARKHTRRRTHGLCTVDECVKWYIVEKLRGGKTNLRIALGWQGDPLSTFSCQNSQMFYLKPQLFSIGTLFFEQTRLWHQPYNCVTFVFEAFQEHVSFDQFSLLYFNFFVHHNVTIIHNFRAFLCYHWFCQSSPAKPESLFTSVMFSTYFWFSISSSIPCAYCSSMMTSDGNT